MTCASLLVLLLAATGPQASPAAAPEAAKPSVLMMSLEPKGGVSKDTAILLTNVLVAEAAKIPGYSVRSLQEVASTMSQEEVRQTAGCDSASCAAEIAGALNTDQIIFGTVGKVGTDYVLTASRVEARSAAILGRAVERLKDTSEAAVLDLAPRVVASLFNTATPAPAATPAPNAPPPAAAAAEPSTSPLPTILRATAGAGAAAAVVGALVAAVMAIPVGVVLAMDVSQGGTPITGPHAVAPLQGLLSNISLGVSLGALALALVAGLAAVVLVLISLVVPS